VKTEQTLVNYHYTQYHMFAIETITLKLLSITEQKSELWKPVEVFNH